MAAGAKVDVEIDGKLSHLKGKFPLMANGKSLIMNGGEGSIKFIVGKEYNEILGVHILGSRATDLIKNRD